MHNCAALLLLQAGFAAKKMDTSTSVLQTKKDCDENKSSEVLESR